MTAQPKAFYLRPVPLGGFAFLLYFFTRVQGYMPGESAFAVSQALPDSMFPTFGHTVWHWIVRLLARLPFGTLSTHLGVFSAFCGGVSVMALAMLAQRVTVGQTQEEENSPANPELIRRLVVGCAVLTFVFSPPIWFAATRPLPQMFGLTLLLLTGAWTVKTFQKRSPAMLNVATIFWGFLVTEYATAWFFIPFFFGLVLYTGFDALGNFRWKRNLRIVGIFLLAAMTGYLLMALTVLNHRHAELQGIHDLGRAFLDSLRVQRNLLTQAAPARGSLLIVILFGAPFLITWLPKMHSTLEARVGSVMMHFAFAITNGFMMFHPSISPWGMYLEGQLGVFMVVPYAMLAISNGYLAGYGARVLAKYDPYQPLALRATRYLLRALVLPVIFLLISVSTALNLFSHGDPHLPEVNRIANEMAEELREVEIYVGQSGFNHVLRLVLREKGYDTQVLDLDPALWSRSAYRNIVAERFADEHPRLASMARIGPGPFLQTWIVSEPDFNETVRGGEIADIIRRSGKQVLPVPYGYEAHDSITPEDAARSAKRLLQQETPDRGELWDTAGEKRGRGRSVGALVVFYGQESRRMNNLGYLLEEHGHDEEAFRAYRSARNLRPDNVSALLNLAMRMEDLPESERERVQGEMKAFQEQLGGGSLDSARLWRLAAHYGYIRHPRMLMERGWAWVASGNPSLAVPELQEALRRFPGAESIRLQLAHTHFAGQDLDASETEYVSILENNPDSANALLGLARINGMRGDTDEALGYLSRLRERGANEAVLRREEVAALTIGGRYEEAAQKADAWLRTQPENAQALLTRILIAEATGEEDKIAPLMERLEGLDELNARERLMLAQFLLRANKIPLARRQLRAAIERPDTRLQAMEMLLRIEVHQRNREEAETLVSSMLSQAPAHPYANYILGTLRLAQNQPREAIAAFETSIASQPSPGALNDLAYTLYDQGRSRQALPLVEQAILLDPNSPHARGTHAAILLDLGRPAEAAEAIQRALERAPDHPPFLITLARVYHAQGKTEEAKSIRDRLLSIQGQLDPATVHGLQSLSDELRPSS